jgi:hypothetical protein
MNAFDPSAGINIGGAMQAGMESRNAMLEMQRQKDAQAFMQQNGAAIMAGDKNAMGQMFGYDPKLASGLMVDQSGMANDSRRTDIASRSADQSIAASKAGMANDAERLEMAREAGRREMEQYAAGADARDLEKMSAHLQKTLLQGRMAMTDPAKWSEFVRSNEIEDDVPVERAEEELKRIEGALGMGGYEAQSPEGKLASDVQHGLLPEGTQSTGSDTRYKVVGQRLWDTQADGGPRPVTAPDGTEPIDPRAESDLRKEWNGLTADFRVVGDAYTRIGKTSQEASPAGDLSMIFSYMKMLDPGSVVRETEFRTAETARPLLESLGLSWDRIGSVWAGERLTPGVRADFLKNANELFEGTAKTYKDQRAQFVGMANDYGFNPERSVPNLDVFDRAEGPAKLLPPPSSSVKPPPAVVDGYTFEPM